jgi:peptide/nickel transport system substrate-binding protein
MTTDNSRRFTIIQPTASLADPHILSDIRDRRSLIDAVCDALVRRDSTGRFVPWLAQDWQVDPTARRWRFTLRRGVRSHDGGTLDAADAAASIRRALSPDLPGELGTQGVLRAYLAGATVVADDAQTLRIDTPTPLADLLDLLVDIPVVPERAHALLPQTLVGSGPYRVQRATPGRVELDAFAAHWAGRPPVDGLLWLAQPDPDERLAALRRGQADLVVDPPRAYAGEPGVRVVSTPGYLCVIFMFNLSSGACRDVRVRRALTHAVDVDALIADARIAAGAALRLAGPLTPRHAGNDPQRAPHAYDPELARRLLRDAGHAAGLELDIDLPARFPDESIALAQRVAGFLAAVGVNARLRVHDDRPGYADSVRSKRFGDLCCFDSSPASAYRVFCEKLDARRQGPWWQGYRNERVHALLDEAAATVDLERRTAKLREISAIVHDDVPWLFLYAPHSRWALTDPGDSVLAADWWPSDEGRVRVIADPAP